MGLIVSRLHVVSKTSRFPHALGGTRTRNLRCYRQPRLAALTTGLQGQARLCSLTKITGLIEKSDQYFFQCLINDSVVLKTIISKNKWNLLPYMYVFEFAFILISLVAEQ